MSQRSISSFFTPKPRDGDETQKSSSAVQPAKSKAKPTTLRTTAPRKSLAAISQNEPADEMPNGPSSPFTKRPLESEGDDEGVTPSIDFSDHLHVAKKPRQSLAAPEQPSPKANGKAKVNTLIRERFSYTPSLSAKASDSSSEPEISIDAEAETKKKRLHEKFVRVLGKPDSIAEIRRRRFGDEFIDGEEVEDDDEEEERQPATRKGQSKAASKRGNKLTPLEQQVVDIKTKHPDTVLVVEVGYKFRFFGEDARTAAGVLSIMCIPGKFMFNNDPSEAHLTKFASASIPVHRLHVHVKRLVAAGHKVGVVRQLETAALKAAGDNRNAPFTRKLTNLYTKGTYVDEIEATDDDLSAAPATGYLLCITEKMAGGNGADEKVKVGLLAVQPSTGDILYDEFMDGFMRTEIETRMLHIAPCELLVLGAMSKATDKLVSHIAGSTTNALGDRIRVERVERPKGMHVEAATHVSTFYADKVKAAQDTSDDSQAKELLDIVADLPELVTVCLSAMITHLEAYGLEHVFDLTKNFQSFSARSHMLLNGNTLSSLEIYTNQTDFQEKGSLFWTLNRTQTKFGRRLLRRWVGRPLLDKRRLEERISAVEELKGSASARTQTLKDLLRKTRYDLEKGLIRIYYGKASRPELLSILQALSSISTGFGTENPDYRSIAINDAMLSLPKIADDVQHYLSLFDHQAARKDDKYNFFIESEEYESINDHKMGIVGVEHDLQEHLKEAAISAKKKKLEYVTVSGIDYLIEIDNASIKSVPATWIKISGTKKLSRFHTPVVVQMLKERDQRKESLAADCDRHFNELQAQIAQKYQNFRNAVQSLAVLDCLVSLATVAMQPGYVKPTFTDETQIIVKQGRHPMVEQLLLDAYVPNDIDLKSNATTTMLLTGPNMGGKSSYVRQVALISIMGQIGSYVPAESAELGLLDAVFTRMGAFDNMMTGESTFMVELSETSDIIKQATSRSLVVLDELGRGTSTHDGVAIAHAVLDHMIADIKALTLFVTHYPILAQFEEKYPKEVLNTHMKFEEAGDGSENVTFLYQVTPGVAHRSYGLNVAKLADVPKSVIEAAAIKSKELELELKGRELSRWVSKLSDHDSSLDEEFLQQLGHLGV